MITEYHRPKTLPEALSLLKRENPPTLPLAGGTTLNRPSKEKISVVDIQELGLDQVLIKANLISIGAAVTLDKLGNLQEVPLALKQSILLEANFNLRQVATVAGHLVTASGRSSLAIVLLALDARLIWEPGSVSTNLGNWLPFRAQEKPGLLITMLRFSLLPRLSFEYIARSPGDLPIVCAAAATWPSGRTRVALGGYGTVPIVVMDGTEADGADAAARDAYSQAGDEWASAEYRSEMAAILTHRCMVDILL